MYSEDVCGYEIKILFLAGTTKFSGPWKILVHLAKSFEELCCSILMNMKITKLFIVKFEKLKKIVFTWIGVKVDSRDCLVGVGKCSKTLSYADVLVLNYFTSL